MTIDKPMEEKSDGLALGYVLALLGVLAFSTRAVLTRLGYEEGVDAETLLALRMGLALPFFIGMGLWGRSRAEAPVAIADIARAAGLGLLGYYLASYLDFLGLVTVPAGLGRLILFLYPTFVIFLSAVFLRQFPGRKELACLAVAYVGLFLVLGAPAREMDSALTGGAFLILMSAVCYSLYLVGSSMIVRRMGSARFTSIAMTAASAAAIAQFFALKPAGTLLEVSPTIWMIAGWIALIATVLPVWATAEALRRIGATKASIVGALGPVSTITLGWIGLNEALTGIQVAGAALIIAGVGMLTLRRKR